MRKLLIASTFLLAGLAVSGVPAMAQKMHKATVEVGMKKTKSGKYYVVKMDGKMYGMVRLSALQRLYDMLDELHDLE